DGNQRLELTTSHFNIRQDSDYTFGTGDAAAGVKTPAVRGRFNVEDPGTTNTLVNLDYDNRDILGSELKTQVYYGNLNARFAKFPGFAQTEVQSEKVGVRSTVDTPAKIAGYGFNVIWGA